MNNIAHKKIAIVGAGPGGLTLARLLQMNGADVKLYERDAHKDARAKGATLDLHEESGLKALQEAGLMDAFWANYRPGADKLRIMDQQAVTVFEDSDNIEAEQRRRPEIDRGPLQQILLESLQPGTVVWDRQLVQLKEQHGCWLLEFRNGKFAIADIVIAADGAHSKLRRYITPIQPFYAGIVAVEGVVYDAAIKIPFLNEMVNGGKIFVMGDEKTLIVGAKGDGSIVFYPGFKKEESWTTTHGIDFTDKAQVVEWFKKEFAGWNEIWLQLFENASGPFILRPQYCMPPDQTWEALPNLTMLGDAAHLMPPYAGEGVNMAMLDALELSTCLLDENYNNVHGAIAAYEIQMRERAAATAAMTLESTAALHSVNAIDFMMQVVN